MPKIGSYGKCIVNLIFKTAEMFSKVFYVISILTAGFFLKIIYQNKIPFIFSISLFIMLMFSFKSLCILLIAKLNPCQLIVCHFWVCFYFLIFLLIKGHSFPLFHMSGNIWMDTKHRKFYILEFQILLTCLKECQTLFWQPAKQIEDKLDLF